MKCLFVGGPWDGEVRDVNPDLWDIVAPQVARELRAESFWVEDLLPVDAPAFETVRYERTKVRLFGELLMVFTLAGLRDPERDRMAMTFLLSPAAKDLIDASHGHKIERTTAKPVPEPRRLSKLLWDAREIADMARKIIGLGGGPVDHFLTKVRDDIDKYRAEQGWNPHGFGGEKE